MNISKDYKMRIVIPSLNRKEKLTNCINSIKKARFGHNINLYLYFSDNSELLYFSKLTKDDNWIHCKIVKDYRVPSFWNARVKEMGEDVDGLMYLNDDVTLFSDTIGKAIKYMTTLYPNTDGIIGMNQVNIPVNQALKTAFGVIGRKFGDRFPDRQILCPEYFRFYSDKELYLYATKVNKFTFCHLVQLEHHHPAFNIKLADSTHLKVRKYLSKDREIFSERQMKTLLWGVNFYLASEFDLKGDK